MHMEIEYKAWRTLAFLSGGDEYLTIQFKAWR